MVDVLSEQLAGWAGDGCASSAPDPEPASGYRFGADDHAVGTVGQQPPRTATPRPNPHDVGHHLCRTAPSVGLAQYADLVSISTAEPWMPPASEVSLRVHADALKLLAQRRGITQLRLASDGKLVGHVAEDRDALDVMDFELDAVRLLGAEVRLYSDRVLDKDNVSPELISARPL